MSNSAAIATVTSVLAKLLETGIKLNDDGNSDPDMTDLDVTTQSPGKARNNKTSNQVNIFLYQVLPNAAVRNMDLPRTVRPGETGLPPIALTLQYLITAYGKGDDDRLGHRILGRAMRILSDFPLIGVSTLFSAAEIQGLLAMSGIQLQPEHVRITPQPLTLDELSKLWMMFQTEYRVSAAYQVSVVLIESMQPVRSAAPVLKRGAGDQGAAVSAARLPILTGVEPSGSLPSATLGADLAILGKSLDVQGIRVRFSSLRLEVPIEVDPGKISPDSVTVHLRALGEDPDAYVTWVPGFYTAALVVRKTGEPALATNEVPLALAPVITLSPLTAPAGDLLLTVTCIPRIRDEQAALLLFGDSQVAAQGRNTPADPSQPTTLTFLVRNLVPGTYLVRLRVDGVDSLPFTIAGTPSVIDFDPTKKVTIT
jgi:hypothetical protein